MTLPSTPIAGTANPNPLVSLAQYRSLINDIQSDDTDAVNALADALYMLSQQCKRTFPYGTYNENLYLYANGMVFPSATPIDHSMPIQSAAGIEDSNLIYNPATDGLVGEGSIIQGAGVWVGWFTPLPWMPVWTGVIPPQTYITYTGGYQPYQATPDLITGQTPTLPPLLAFILVRITFYLLFPVMLQGMPSGVKSMSVGGVSMSGSLSSMMLVDPQLRADIRRFTRPQAHAWET